MEYTGEKLMRKIYASNLIEIIRFAVLAILLLPGEAGATALTVDDSGGADYTKIQDAIDNASSGDTILVNSGTYFENVNVTEPLILSGVNTGEGNPVIDAKGSGSALTLSAGDSILERFVAVNANYGIRVTSNNNQIEIITASNNRYGISFEYSSNNKFEASTVSNNNFGISLANSSNNTVAGNYVLNNTFGISLTYSSNNLLAGNFADYNNEHGIGLISSSNNALWKSSANSNKNSGVFLDSSNNNSMDSSSAFNNNIGIWLRNSSNNKLSCNDAGSNSEYGIFLQDSSNNTIYNTFFNNTKNFRIDNSVNTWNITKTRSLSIIDCPYQGGNFWANPDGKGTSQTCEDGDGDGICDSPYKLEQGNIDYLPLSSKTAKAAGFEVVLAIATLSAIAYLFRRKKR